MLNNQIPTFTKEGQKVMQSMIKSIGTKHALNAITDYAKVIDLNKDNKLNDKEIGLLKTAIKKDGSIDKQKLQKNIHLHNAITDYAKVIDLNKDGKLDDKEIGLLETAIQKDGSIDKQKLQKNIDEYKSKNIITISSPMGKNGWRDIVQFQGYTDINEYQNNKLTRIIGVSKDSISVTQYEPDGTSTTNTIPKTPENIEKYLKDIDLA